MLQLTALAVSATQMAYRQSSPGRGDTLVVSWERNNFDPDDIWYLDVDVVGTASAIR
jgi:hypothetical protein